MKKLTITFIIVIVLIASAPLSFASDVNCGYAKIEYVQVSMGGLVVFVLEGQDWHLIGNVADIGVKEMYAALLSAQMAGKEVTVYYPEGYVCGAYDVSTPAKRVRVRRQ